MQVALSELTEKELTRLSAKLMGATVENLVLYDSQPIFLRLGIQSKAEDGHTYISESFDITFNGDEYSALDNTDIELSRETLKEISKE